MTTPAPGQHVDQLRFAFASCQKWDDGYYSAYRRVAEEDIDLVIHLGDYIYEYGIGSTGGFRNVPVPDRFAPETITLGRYRLQHALYRPTATTLVREGLRSVSGPCEKSQMSHR
jgi:alkaline phosphatase D